MGKIKFVVISVEEKLFEENVDEVILNTGEEEIVVDSQTDSLIRTIEKGILTIINEGNEIKFKTSSGIFKVDDNCGALMSYKIEKIK